MRSNHAMCAFWESGQCHAGAMHRNRSGCSNVAEQCQLNSDFPSWQNHALSMLKQRLRNDQLGPFGSEANGSEMSELCESSVARYASKSLTKPATAVSADNTMTFPPSAGKQRTSWIRSLPPFSPPCSLICKCLKKYFGNIGMRGGGVANCKDRKAICHTTAFSSPSLAVSKMPQLLYMAHAGQVKHSNMTHFPS